MNKTALLAASALALSLLALPALAQDTTTDNDAEVQASVPAERIADRYADDLFDGDEDAAAETVEQLREGGDIEVTNADGTTTTIENANGPMGYGEVNIALGMAEKMVNDGDAETWQDALYGTADTTNADGTTTAGTDGVLAMRADGMGWGKIAKELGFSLGTVVGKAPKRGDETADDGTTDGSTDGTTTTAKKSDHATKTERTAKTERTKTERTERAAKPERVAKVDRPQRPDRVEKPSRPERPQKPERGGRN